MKKNGVYQYDYMLNFDKSAEKQLLKQDDFYSLLNDEYITDEQYIHAQNSLDENNGFAQNLLGANVMQRCAN